MPTGQAARGGVVLGTLVLAVGLALAAEQGPAIGHAPVGCVVAGKFPRFEARFDPAATVARALVHFRPEGGTQWYAVAMKRDAQGSAGVLPKPKSSLTAFRYYIDVTDSAFATSRTAEYTTAVVTGPGACRGKLVASALGSASVLLEAPAGAPVVPAGFASSGVAGAGAGTAGAGAAGATGGGIGAGTVALIVGGGAAVAGAAVAVAKGRGSSGAGNGGDNGSTGPRPLDVTFTPDVDVSACAGRQLSWCCQNLHPDASGRFDETWSPGEPNTARITGSASDTTFTATLTCVSGGSSGSLSASGSGGTYQGSFAFGNSRGALTVKREGP